MPDSILAVNNVPMRAVNAAVISSVDREKRRARSPVDHGCIAKHIRQQAGLPMLMAPASARTSCTSSARESKYCMLSSSP